jgi:hypothetical protein
MAKHQMRQRTRENVRGRATLAVPEVQEAHAVCCKEQDSEATVARIVQKFFKQAGTQEAFSIENT